MTTRWRFLNIFKHLDLIIMHVSTEYLQDDVFSYLSDHGRGRKSAIKADQIASILGVGLRAVNEAVRQLRKRGLLIGSAKEKPYGYYLPQGPSEIKEYLDTFKSELFDMLETYQKQCRAVKDCLENGQYGGMLFRFDEDGQLQMSIPTEEELI